MTAVGAGPFTSTCAGSRMEAGVILAAGAVAWCEPFTHLPTASPSSNFSLVHSILHVEVGAIGGCGLHRIVGRSRLFILTKV